MSELKDSDAAVLGAGDNGDTHRLVGRHLYRPQAGREAAQPQVQAHGAEGGRVLEAAAFRFHRRHTGAAAALVRAALHHDGSVRVVGVHRDEVGVRALQAAQEPPRAAARDCGAHSGMRHGAGRKEVDSHDKGRAGKGVLTYKITSKTGNIVGVELVDDHDEVMLITDTGVIIRLNVDDISILGRNTQGVTLMRTSDGGKVINIAKVPKEETEEE